MRPALTLTITAVLCLAFVLCGACLLSAAEPDFSPLTGSHVHGDAALDFSSLAGRGSMSASSLQFDGLQFNQLAGTTAPEKWRIRVYSATWCGLCRKVHHDWTTLSDKQREALPFQLEFDDRVPRAVKGLPTFAFTARDGSVQTFEGYTSLASVQTEFEARKQGESNPPPQSPHLTYGSSPGG